MAPSSSGDLSCSCDPARGRQSRCACSPTDDLGIVRLTTEDVPWGALGPTARAVVAAATTPAQVIDQMVDGERPWPRQLQRALLHPASGGAATLVVPRPGTVALDLGTGWSGLGRALRSFGVTVVSADWVYLRLRFARLMGTAGDGPAVHLPAGGRLPWPEESFDYVFLDLAQVDHCAVDRARVLGEVRRVLKGDGVAVLGTANPWHRRPRPAVQAGAVRHRLVRPWEPAELRGAGLRTSRVLVPFPRREEWRWIVPERGLRTTLPSVVAPSTVRRLAVRLALQAGLGRWFLPEYFIVARRTGVRASDRTLAEALVREAGTPLTMALSDARVAVRGDREFIKVPLSVDQQQALELEAEKTERARGTPFGPFVVPAAAGSAPRVVPCAVYPMVRGGDRIDAAEVLTDALSRMDASVQAPLSTTVFWRRLASSRAAADAEEAGAGTLRESVLRSFGDATVPVGPTHGDLHPGNVLVPDRDHPLLVDWNRFETHNPLLLDAVYAAVEVYRSAADGPVGTALLAFAEGRLPGPLAHRARALLGDLTPAQAVTVVLLDRVVSYSLPRRRHKPWTLTTWQEASSTLTDRILPRLTEERVPAQEGSA